MSGGSLSAAVSGGLSSMGAVSWQFCNMYSVLFSAAASGGLFSMGAAY